MSVDWMLPQQPQWVQLAVLVRLDAEAPDAGFLTDRAKAWIGAQVGPAFRDAMREMMRIDMVRFQSGALPVDLRPPLDLARKAGDDAAARVERATHVVFVGSPNFCGMPPWGYWLALASARAAAVELDGVVYDPAVSMVHPVEWNTQAPRYTVPAPVSHYTGFAWRESGERAVTLQTVGLDRLGLPDLVTGPLPTSDVHHARWVLLGAAWLLLRQAIEHKQHAPDDQPMRIDQLQVDGESMLRAVGDERPVQPGAMAVGLGVGLEGDPDGQPVLRVFSADSPDLNVGAALAGSGITDLPSGEA